MQAFDDVNTFSIISTSAHMHSSYGRLSVKTDQKLKKQTDFFFFFLQKKASFYFYDQFFFLQIKS